MGLAIEHIRARLDNEPLHTQLVVSREVLREVIAEADAAVVKANNVEVTITPEDHPISKYFFDEHYLRACLDPINK